MQTKFKCPNPECENYGKVLDVVCTDGSMTWDWNEHNGHYRLQTGQFIKPYCPECMEYLVETQIQIDEGTPNKVGSQ